MKRTRTLFLLGFVALTMCKSNALDPSDGAVESIVVAPAISTVSVGARLDLDAQVLDATGNALLNRPVHWASEDVEIATVSDDGTVTARKIGTTQVAASTGGRSGLAQITVTATPVASVSVSPGNKALFVEESFQFTAETRDAGGNVLTNRPVTWSSNNEGVATVSATGLVTALAPGGAIITASAEGRSAPASVTVSAIPVASVEVQPSTQTLVEGQTAQLQAKPLDASGKQLVGRVIMWSTTDANVATVTSTGLVTARARGTAEIRATCEGKSGSTAVTVNPRPPNAVVITPAQVLIEQGTTTQITAQVLDDMGAIIPNSPVTFSSSATNIATVSSSGVITGVATGTATVSATSGGKTGTAQVTVAPIPVGSVVVTPANPFVTVGRTTTLTAQALSVSGQPLTGRTVSWSSGTPAIASVNAQGVVTGMSVGSTVMFASIDGVLGWTNVTVVPVAVASVTVSPSTANVPIGQTTQLSAVLKDASGNTLTGRLVSWTSSQTSIATVTTGGAVSGVSTGTVTISATSEGKVGTATITVVAPGVRTVTVIPDTATIGVSGTIQLTAIVRDPSGAIIGASVTWSSSNVPVALVSSNGTVTGLLKGTAVITAKSGSATGTATITVK